VKRNFIFFFRVKTEKRNGKLFYSFRNKGVSGSSKLAEEEMLKNDRVGNVF